MDFAVACEQVAILICGFALSVLCATHSCLEFSAKPFVEGIVAQQQLAC